MLPERLERAPQKGRETREAQPPSFSSVHVCTTISTDARARANITPIFELRSARYSFSYERAPPIATGEQGSLGAPACQSACGHHTCDPWSKEDFTHRAQRAMQPTCIP